MRDNDAAVRVDTARAHSSLNPLHALITSFYRSIRLQIVTARKILLGKGRTSRRLEGEKK